MADDGFTALRAQLGGEAPDGLRALDDEHLRDLAGAIAGARRRQTAILNAAGDRALGMVPRLLRGPVKKLVG
jgi:hypothetical protein